jgi:hypothetical protein
MKPRVDDLDTGVSKGAGHYLDASVVTVEARLRYKDTWTSGRQGGNSPRSQKVFCFTVAPVAGTSPSRKVSRYERGP